MVKVKLYRIKNSDRKFSLSTNILRYLWFKFNLSHFFLTYSFVKIFRGFILGTFCLVQQIFNTCEHKTYRVLNFFDLLKKAIFTDIYIFKPSLISKSTIEPNRFIVNSWELVSVHSSKSLVSSQSGPLSYQLPVIWADPLKQ